MKCLDSLCFYIWLLLATSTLWSQNPVAKTTDNSQVNIDFTRKAEDEHGHLITDPEQLKQHWLRKAQAVKDLQNNQKQTSVALTSLPLCQNGNFEEFEQTGSSLFLKGYAYGTTDLINPTQCRSGNINGTSGIPMYNPANFSLMSTTVPSNYIDEYIGNINGFDQYLLKINYENSFTTLSVVQSKRHKTNNETTLKFNYKSVLQTIYESGHDNEQPFFKARVINSSGAVVDEFCLIGDVNNCIFKQAPVLAAGSIILYNENWQSCYLDISSIPNNQDFTVEFTASRCGLGGHFGYVYIDDVCNIHSNENLQGSITLDPLNKICPTFPISVCGSFSTPNSGGISASVNGIELKILDANNQPIYTSTTPTSIDLVNERFCFDITAADLPNQTNGSYNASATINFGTLQTACSATQFGSALDDDANSGWDIWFLNCTDCPIDLHPTERIVCDTDRNGTEVFDLTTFAPLVTSNLTGITFSYHTSLTDATANTNPIQNLATHTSGTNTIFVRASSSDTCFKITAIELIVKAPSATISGILNVCSGSTVLTASPGTSYLWGDGSTSQSITVSSPGTYQVSVVDANGCSSTASTTILANQVAVLPTLQISQPGCFSSVGRIEVTSPAALISFDGGSTWGTSPVLDPAAVGTYQVKIKTASGCVSYNSAVNIVPVLPFFPSCSWDNPDFCGDVGSITVNTPASFYSFDDGATWTTDNFKNNLPAGVYKIRTKDSAGCVSNLFSAELESVFLDRPDYIQNNPYCGNPGSIEITTPAAEYSFDGGTTWQTSNIKTNLPIDSYVIRIKDAQGCTSPNTYVYLQNFENTYPSYQIFDAGCGVYASIKITTPADFYSFDDGLTWTTDPLAINLTSNATYKLKIRRGPTCVSRTQFVTIYSQYYPIPLANDYTTNICDALNDQKEQVDFTLYESNLIASPTSYTFKYFTDYNAADQDLSWALINNPTNYNLQRASNKVYVRVISVNNCYKVVKLEFNFIDAPRIYMDALFPLCQFTSKVIDAGPGYNSYFWSTGETTRTITVTEPKHYWVTVTENHNTSTGLLICDSRKDFDVFLSNPAIITDVKTTDWTENENSIEIIAIGLGNYEYSIDGINYQDNNHFEPLKNGIYTVYVRDKYDCGTVKEKVFLLIYPKYFTPNGDGFHDTWKLRLSEFEPGLTVKIFDRNGKFLKQLANQLGWDGTLNNQPLPADDYWFVVTRADGTDFRGHFSLKR